MSDEHNTPGWNEYVKDAHSETRDAFKLWILSSKPRQGDVFQYMTQSRARFKFKLRQCKCDEARIRADILADDLVKGGGGGAGRKTILLIFQPSHFIVHLL